MEDWRVVKWVPSCNKVFIIIIIIIIIMNLYLPSWTVLSYIAKSQKVYIVHVMPSVHLFILKTVSMVIMTHSRPVFD